MFKLFQKIRPRRKVALRVETLDRRDVPAVFSFGPMASFQFMGNSPGFFTVRGQLPDTGNGGVNPLLIPGAGRMGNVQMNTASGLGGTSNVFSQFSNPYFTTPARNAPVATNGTVYSPTNFFQNHYHSLIGGGLGLVNSFTAPAASSGTANPTGATSGSAFSLQTVPTTFSPTNFFQNHFHSTTPGGFGLFE